MIWMLAAELLWLAFAAWSVVSRESFPKRGFRRAEVMLLGASVVLALAWMTRFDPKAMWHSSTPVASASVVTPKGSCASLRAGMTRKEVESSMGRADEVRSEEETRGPGTTTMTYRASQCSVHLLDGKVELID